MIYISVVAVPLLNYVEFRLIVYHLHAFWVCVECSIHLSLWTKAEKDVWL